LQRWQLRLLGVAVVRRADAPLRARRKLFRLRRAHDTFHRVCLELRRPCLGIVDGTRSPMKRLGSIAVVVAIAVVSSAHIGSPDVFFDGNAGPYKVNVRITPPTVVPGVAWVYVRAAD